MAKSHYTCTYIKGRKEFACCVWKHSKNAYVSHIMMIWDIRKTNTLTHNYNYLMGTITFEIHPITPTSSRNMLAIIFKSILILSSFFFSFFFLHIFFLNISCMAGFSGEMVIYSYEREREEIPNYVSQKITILLCWST